MHARGPNDGHLARASSWANRTSPGGHHWRADGDEDDETVTKRPHNSAVIVMTPTDLLAGLADGTALRIDRIARLDWHGDVALDRCLADAAGVDVRWVEALRVPRRNALETEKWGRATMAWCPDCLCDDIDSRGETYGRLIWRLGFCVTCPRHRRRPVRACGRCGTRGCGFHPRRGRLRLVCAACNAVVDQQADQITRHRQLTAGPLGLLPGAGLDRLVAELQTDLLASLDLACPRL